jgi:hypothetical protein
LAFDTPCEIRFSQLPNIVARELLAVVFEFNGRSPSPNPGFDLKQPLTREIDGRRALLPVSDSRGSENAKHKNQEDYTIQSITHSHFGGTAMKFRRSPDPEIN